MIVVSHRGPYRFSRSDDGTFSARRGAGGVVSALGPLLLDSPVEHTWVAAAMSDDDVAASRAGEIDDLGVDLRLLDLDSEEHRLHYDVVSNRILWFLFHDLFDHARNPVFDRDFHEAWDAYVAVNEAFADATAEAATAGDVVLVQDYQLALVPEMLRAQRPDLKIVHFTHTPFCGADGIRTLPPEVARRLCGSLATIPAGFHTRRWADAYWAAAHEVLEPESPVHVPFVASLGADLDSLRVSAADPKARAAAAALDDVVGDRLVILRTDRVEPSKNIVRGFIAYDRLLEARPGLRGRVVFAAMVYSSRQSVPEYARYAEEIEATVARVNDRWATRDWTPIVLDERDDYARSVAGMQRYDVLFVNPVKDGLNLVAKEGPLLNRRDGVLCLSREAGAYDELRDGVLALQPFDVEQMAGALDDALTMPLDERATIATRLQDLVMQRTPRSWLSDLVAHAG